VEDAEVDVLFEKGSAGEQENGVVSSRRLERIEDLDSIETVSVNSEALGDGVEGGSIFNRRGNTKRLKPQDGAISGL
jgi:hypothetical protein